MLTFSSIILLVTGSESQGKDTPGSNDKWNNDLIKCLTKESGGANWNWYNTCYKVWKQRHCDLDESKNCCPETCAPACFQEEMNYSGETLPHPNFKHLKSPYECQKDCDETKDCTHWTWSWGGRFVKSYQCQLRKKKGEEKPRGAGWWLESMYPVISGSKDCHQTKTLASVYNCLYAKSDTGAALWSNDWTCQEISEAKKV